MKKAFLFAVIAILLIAGMGWADSTVAVQPVVVSTPVATDTPTADLGILSNLPGVKQGMAMDMRKGTNDIYSLTSVDIVNFGKGKFGLTEDKISLGGGLLSNFGDTNIPALTLNYKIGGLDKYGFSYPLANLINIEVGLFAGKELTAGKEWKYGIEASIIKVKF